MTVTSQSPQHTADTSPDGSTTLEQLLHLIDDNRDLFSAAITADEALNVVDALESHAEDLNDDVTRAVTTRGCERIRTELIAAQTASQTSLDTFETASQPEPDTPRRDRIDFVDDSPLGEADTHSLEATRLLHGVQQFLHRTALNRN